jgi:hypothetical protein
VGTVLPQGGAFTLTVSAATPKPVQIVFPELPDAAALRDRLLAEISDGGYFEDVHGSPEYRQHVTHYYAEQIRAELATA